MFAVGIAALAAAGIATARRLWPASRNWREPGVLPTLMPTARAPLSHDLTPPIPCPAGEHRLWQSFGAMPAANLMMTAWMDYPPVSLCAPTPSGNQARER